MKAIFCYNDLLLDGWGPEFGAASLEWQKVVRNQKQPWSAPSCWDPGSSVFLALMEWLSLEEYFSFKQRKWFSYNISIKNSTVYLISLGACVPCFGAFSFLSFFFSFFWCFQGYLKVELAWFLHFFLYSLSLHKWLFPMRIRKKD